MKESSRADALRSRQCRAMTGGRAAIACAAALMLHVVTGCLGSVDDHAEEPHVRPAHHPGSFRAAVAEIDRRTAEDRPDGSADTAAGGTVRELADIVGWLPELAAGTGLGRQEWDRVHAVSRRLGGLLERAAASPGRSIGPEARAAVRESLAILEAAAAAIPDDDPVKEGP